MNERIRELAEQAGGSPNYKAFRGHFLPPPPDYIDPATVDLEKFAELIVRECISVRTELTQFDGTTKYGDGYENGLKDMAKVIAEIFGVEE